MPVSPEAYLISSVLRDGDVNTALAHGITANMFHGFHDEWEWIERYYQRYRKAPTKNAFLSHFPTFRVKGVNDTGHYADEVRKSHARYSLTGTMRDVADKLGDGDIDSAVETMSQSIVSIAAEMGTGQNDVDVIRDYRGIFGEVKRRKIRHDKYGMAGLPTGFPTLDERTGGPQAGQVWVMSARLGQGKSWAMLRMAIASIMAGYRIQFNALEQSTAEVGTRVHTLLSSEMGKELFRNLDLMQGRDFSLTAYRRFLGQLKTNIKGTLMVSDSSRGKLSTLGVAAQVERNRPDGVFVDYITLMDMQGDGDWRSIGRLTKDFKSIAGKYEVPIIGAAQINRSGVGREPAGPESLAGSDEIGQDADGIIAIRQMSPSVLVMKMTKNRHGPGGFKWYCDFRPTEGVFKECTYDEAMDLKDKDAERDDKDGAKR
jgi:replicative DNA helicase